jgi:lipoprotein Spr
MKVFRTLSFGCLVVSILAIGACSGQKRAKKPSSRSTHSSSRPSPSKAVSNASSSGTKYKSKYAQQLGVEPSQLKSERLYAFINEWEGIPYRYGGTSKTGVDCSGFVGALYREVYSKNLPRTTSEIGKVAKSVSKSNLSEGDIVIFDINGKKGSHMGVYLANNKFVHASTSKGVVISDLNNPYYVKAFSRGGKI